MSGRALRTARSRRLHLRYVPGMSGGLGADRIPRQRLVNIQILRGVAALLVVIAHSIDASETVAGPDWGIRSAGFVENFGAFGVDLFFVISGFVMAFSAQGLTGPRAAGDFLARRWIRVAPPYLIATLIAVALGAAVNQRPSLRGIANTLLFVPVLDTSTYTSPPLTVGWTLSFEFTFYLFVVLAVLCGLGRRIEWIGVGLLALVVVALVLPDGPFLAHWFTNPMLLEFALGVGVYALWRRRLLDRVPMLWLGVGALGIATLIVELVAGFGLISEQRYTLDGSLSLLRVLLWGIPAAAIFAAAVAVPEPRPTASERGWRHLGDVSYSTYLIHYPVIGLISVLLAQTGLQIPGGAVLLLEVVAGVGCGLIFYRFIERPLTRLVLKVYRGQRRDVAASPDVP